MRDFHFPGRSPVLATNGMCATSHPIAAKVALDILERGGNAMDAAVAGAVLLGIAEPQMTGLGGDCFVLFSPAGSQDILALNGSGRAPVRADAQALRDQSFDQIPLQGTESVTVPGAVDAFCLLAQEHGKLGLDVILQPAIRYAEEGIPVSERVAFDWKNSVATLKGHAKRHYLVDGKVPKPGDIFRSPGQAEVFRRIAKNGRSAFYEGEIAEDMLTALSGLGGVHTADDFAKNAPSMTTPICSTYKNVELIEHPPNGQGATANLILNILKHFDLSELDPFGARRAHIEAEVSKLAYDARNRFIADLDYSKRAEKMLSPDVAAKLAALVDLNAAMPAATSLTEAIHKDTVYITVVDRDRMAVSMIYSIFHGFGSGIASEKFGILFHNRGAGFSLEPNHPNEYGGGKRPMHTIIPGMLAQNGKVIAPFGVMGGAYQPCGHARFISNMFDFGMTPQSSIDAPRCFADAGKLKIERGYNEQVRKDLYDLGHILETPEAPLGGAQTIIIHENGTLEGASDSRKDGAALGY